MFLQRFSLIAFVLVSSAVSVFAGETGTFLDHFNKTDKRYPTFRKVLELLEERGAKTLVETGTSRDGTKNWKGDGASTCIFATWASRHGAHLYSVDLSPLAVRRSRHAVAPVAAWVDVICGDSVHYLENFDREIDFLYLDSYDYDANNPGPSQNHHLKEIKAAYDKLSDECFILIDDCGCPGGGKGGLVIPYLEERGWTVLMEEYQVLLVRE